MGMDICDPMQDNFLFGLHEVFFFLLKMVEADYRGAKECSIPDLDFVL